MFNKKTLLKYESDIEEFPNIVTSSKNNIPNWYKKIPKWDNDEIFTVGKGFNKTLKQCVPFLESLTVGYMVVLANDIYVKDNNGVPFLAWNENIKYPPKWRNDVADINLVPKGHYPLEYTWQIGTSISVPLGYSMLITHPLNRHDLPFTTLSAVVDGGLAMNPRGSVPFYIKQGFEGIIKQGTPILQIIPFRQEVWLLKKIKGLVKMSFQQNNKSLNLINGWYKKTFWTQKHYN